MKRKGGVAPRRPLAHAGSRKSSREVGQESRSGDLLWATGLTLLAWLHRIFFVFSTSDSALPFSGFYHGDAETFFRYARAILGGQTYDSGIPFHPPGFPYFLAGIHGFLGVGASSASAQVPHLQVKLCLALISSLSVGLIYLLVKPYLGRAIALVTAGLCLYHFGLYVFAVATVSEGLFLTLLLLAILIWSRRLDHPLAAPAGFRKRQALWGLLLGILFGLLALVRAESALIAVSLWSVGFTGWCLRGRRGEATVRALAPWLLVAAGVVMTLAPWTFRNARNLQDLNERLGPSLVEPLPTLVPLTLYGPLNLALANHGGADGTFSRDLMSSQSRSGHLDPADPQHLSFLLHGDRMAWSYIRSHPRDYLSLVVKKWRLLLEATKLGWTQWNWPGGLTGIRRPVDIFVPYSNAAKWIHLPLLLLGWGVCLRKSPATRRWALTATLVSGCTFAVVALFFGYARQGLLLTPLWMSLQATALVTLAAAAMRLAGHPAGGRPRRWIQAATALALIFFLMEAWGATRARKFEATGTTLPGRLSLNPDLTVYMKPLI